MVDLSTIRKQSQKLVGKYRLSTSWLVVIGMSVLLGTAIGLFLSSSLPIRWSLNRRARNWEPTAADLARPEDGLLAPNMNVVGEWFTGIGSTSLTIKPGGGSYEVKCDTGGCLWRCDFQREGIFAKSELRFDLPIIQYNPVAFDRVFAVRFRDKDYLLPPANVKRFMEYTSSIQEDDIDSLRWLAFVRR
ncbi:hypothetical protein HG15A2_39800 [Adhaeretor mobilis]|uniref:Uncharacterized protein n=1 Tax=Adhaeretor mobilis TaxID=1930276 RepID=A0A517N0H7_9BACT|nr:hypothetical protein HG15A2_39800 [Adhaeretor mobilis]